MSASLDLLARLVGFDTVSARPNRALIDFAADHLRSAGATVEVIPSACGHKANLWATIGPPVDGGVVLAGHSDVVPVEGQPWSSDPFVLRLEGGRAYGRGACDMKGFIACALAAAPALAARALRVPVHVALTFDEEVGCIGAPELLDWLERQTPKPAICFVGEPTMMAPVDAHKGILLATTTIRGVEAHSSLAHQGISAIGLAGRAIALLQRIEAEVTARDPRFTPDRTTISVNRIEGGTAVNILAGECRFAWDIRSIPESDARALLARFEAALETELIGPVRAAFPAVSASTRVMADAPGLAPETDGAAIRLATRLTGANATSAVPYAAEAGQYQRAGLSTIIIGPGSIEQAHKADEYVELAQLAACDAFLARLGEALSA